MKFFIFILSLLFLIPSSSWAKYIQIDSKIYFAGKIIGSPRILNQIGEKSKMLVKDNKTNRDYNLAVRVKSLSNNIILLRYNLSIRKNNNEILSRGSIKIANGSSGRILLDHRRVEIHFKLKSMDNTKSYVKN